MHTLKAAVIGLGEMGQHHARVYAQTEDVRLVAVCDSDPTRLENVTRTWGAMTYTDVAVMFAECRPDLVTVAVPTVHHLKVAGFALTQCHVLVEKPITHTVEAARALIGMAQEVGHILAVGHIERCNPVVSAVKRHIDAGDLGRIYRISTRRVGPSPVRIRDVGVVIDLLTHDLDIARYLLRSEPLFCQAELQHNRHGTHEDGVDALVRFENGTVGIFECDWLTPSKTREMRIDCEAGSLAVDYIKQSGTFLHEGGKVEQITVPYTEPLRVELEAFASAVQYGTRPAADGQDGFAALRVALAVLEAGHGLARSGAARSGEV